MGAATLATIASVIVAAILGWLTIRATRRSTVDAKAANELAARDRLLEARDRDIEARDRMYDQIQEERNRIEAQLHAALEQLDMQAGQIRTLEELAATLRRNDPRS